MTETETSYEKFNRLVGPIMEAANGLLPLDHVPPGEPQLLANTTIFRTCWVDKAWLALIPMPLLRELILFTAYRRRPGMFISFLLSRSTAEFEEPEVVWAANDWLQKNACPSRENLVARELAYRCARWVATYAPAAAYGNLFRVQRWQAGYVPHAESLLDEKMWADHHLAFLSRSKTSA